MIRFSPWLCPTIRHRALEIAPAAAAIPLAMLFDSVAKSLGFSFGWGSVLAIVLLLSLLAPWLWLQTPRSRLLYALTGGILVLFSIPVVMELLKDQFFGARHRYESDIDLNFPEYAALAGLSFLVPILFRLSVHWRMCRVNQHRDTESWRSARGSTSDLMALTFGASLWLATVAKTDPDRLSALLRMSCVLITVSTTVLLAAWILERIVWWRVLLGYVACATVMGFGWWFSVSIRRTNFLHPIWETLSELQEQLLSPWPSYKWTDSIQSAVVLAMMSMIYVMILQACGLKLMKEPPIT